MSVVGRRFGQVETYLHEQEQVRVLALGGGADALLDVVFLDIDTLKSDRSVRRQLIVASGALTILVCSCGELLFGEGRASRRSGGAVAEKLYSCPY